MVNDELMKMWREEFVKYLHDNTFIPNNKHDDPAFIDFHYRREWLVYLTARENAQVEIESLKKELHQQRFNNKHNLSIDQKVSDEIESLKERIAHLEFEIVKRDRLLERAKHMVDFYQDVTMSVSKWDECEQWLKEYGELK
jgi:hypothetical protein